jgi:hypothetical protein
MMEERGFATTVIGLIRWQMEQVRAPRGLWTPFELGRPLGEPGDAAFQTRVLMQALRLLERTDGPVILEDFPDDPPNWTDTPDWQPPLTPADPPGTEGEELARLETEMARIAPVWEQAQRRLGRTTVGLSGLDPSQWPDFFAALLRGKLPVSAMHNTTALAARFLCDDLKAMYSEAAQAVGKAPSSRQIENWFWHSTVAARVLFAARRVAMASNSNALKTVGGRFFVRTPFLPKE